MLHITRGPLVYEFDRQAEPRARVNPGESLIVESENALSWQIRNSGDRRDKSTMPYSNPMTGPIYVEGAECGDALAVTIHSIHPTLGKCFTRVAHYGQLSEWLGTAMEDQVRICDISNGRIHWSDRISIPYTPMLGCIGTCPDWGRPAQAPQDPMGATWIPWRLVPGTRFNFP